MSIMRRIRDLTAAYSCEWLCGDGRDPVREIDAALADCCRRIAESEQLYRQIRLHLSELLARAREAEEAAGRRAKQAELALRAEEEDLARLAVRDKIRHEEDAARYRRLYEECAAVAAELKVRLDEWREEYAALLSRRDYVLARLETYRLRRRLSERPLGGWIVYSDVLERLEERLRELERETEALREVRRLTERVDRL